MLFLAPETGGDFSTFMWGCPWPTRSICAGLSGFKPGSMDRSPLDTYLAGIKETADTDPKVLHERSLVLARSLKIKVDEQCFDKLTEEQAPCLMRNPDQLVLDDGHSQSIVAVLTSGPGGDLVER